MTMKKVSKRSKIPVRWAVVIVSLVLTVVFFRTILEGPAPAHAAPVVVPVVQQAPALDELVNQVEAQSSDDSSGGFTVASSPAPRFRTRGS